MKKDKRFFGVGICALLAVLFVFSANVLASEVSITKIAGSYYERVAENEYGDSDEWMNKDDEEYKEEYKEESEEQDEDYQGDPWDSGEEPPTEVPFDDENLLTAPEADDLAMDRHWITTRKLC